LYGVANGDAKGVVVDVVSNMEEVGNRVIEGGVVYGVITLASNIYALTQDYDEQ